MSEEIEEKNEIKPRTFRIDNSANERFKQLASDLNVTQDKMFRDLITVYEMEQSKYVLADRSKEIEEFQNHANRLINIYLNSLELNKNTESIISEQFSQQLSRKQELIINLQDQVKKFKEDIKEQNVLLSNTLNENGKLGEELVQLKDTLETKETLITEYKNKIDSLTSLVTEYTDFKLKEQENIKVLSDIKEKNSQLELELKSLNLEKNSLEKHIELLKSNTEIFKSEINSLKLEHKEVIKNIETNYKNELLKTNKNFEEYKLMLKNEITEKVEFDKGKLILEKDKLIFEKDKEIENLKNEIDKLKLKNRKANNKKN